MRNALLAIALLLGAAAALPSSAAAQSPLSSAPADAAPPALSAPPAPPAPSAEPPAPPMSSATFGPPSQAALPPPAPAAPPRVDANGKPRSEDLAIALSLGGTLLSWGLLFSGDRLDDSGQVPLIGLIGTFLAPNFGHWYQGVPLTRGTGFRAVGLLAMGYGLMPLMTDCIGSCDDSFAIFLGGALVYIAATVDDIIDAPRRVRKHNRSLQLGVAPMVSNRTTGLALGGSF